MAQSGFVKITIFNLEGQSVKTLTDGPQGPGRYTLSWNGRDGTGRPVATGTYIIQMVAGDFARARKVQLLR